MNLRNLNQLGGVLLLSLLFSYSGLDAQANQGAEDDHVRDAHRLRQTMYESYEEAFPAPKRNNWSLGVQSGFAYVSGDVRSDRGVGIGINARKALGHFVSIRFQGVAGYARGQNWRPNGGFFYNSALNGASDPAANYVNQHYPYVFYNFRTEFADLNAQGVVNLGNINFYNKQSKLSFYSFVGVGGMAYQTKVDALDESGAIYDYSGVLAGQDLNTKKDVLNSLRNLLDGEYETAAESHAHKNKIGNATLVPTATFGGGVALRLSRRVDLSLEHRGTWSGDDLIDGHRWEETRTLTANADILQFTTLGINFKIGKGEESLWWKNPLDQIYSDVRDLKRFNANGDTDSDLDGVPDDRDLEDDTPEGVLVDGNGMAIDSDGDGLRDYQDKEPFSPKGANVDNRGVALDSDSDGVIDFYDQEPNTPAGAQADAEGREIKVKAVDAPVVRESEALPVIYFALGKSDIKEEYLESLRSVAKMLKSNPSMRLKVIGHADTRGTSKRNEELSKARANAVVNMLVRGYGISPDRIFPDYQGASNLFVKDIAPAESPENEQLHLLNRRVEFEVIR